MGQDNEVFFEVDSRLLYEIGEKLVTNRAIALAELIKNSFDADATKAIITLNKIKNPGGSITIQDNGIGMNEETFKRGWMRIATIFSEEKPISPKYKRTKSGQKGIGRFACRKLAKKLLLSTISEGENGIKTELSAKFDWPKFVPGSDVDKIPTKYNLKQVDSSVSTGTTLILENTTEPWTERNIVRLKNEISELFTPLIFLEEEKQEKKIAKKIDATFDPGFHYEFISKEFSIGPDTLDKAFFENAWAILTGEVDENGLATYNCSIQQRIIHKFSKPLQREIPFKQLRSAKFKIFIFSYRTDLFKNEWTSSKSQVIGRERGGVKVYADKFRVFGYGEKGNDWLCVDYDRARSRAAVDEELVNFYNPELRPGLALFRNAALFGYVTFNHEKNPNLEILINRDRLDSESSAFKELRKFVRLGIDHATVIYASEIEEDQKLKENQKKLELDKIKQEDIERQKKAEEEKRKAIEAATLVEKQKKKAQEDAQNAILERQKAEQERRNAEEERRHAELLRREAEAIARKKPAEPELVKAEQARQLELEKIKQENELRQKEEQSRTREIDAIKKADETREIAEAAARTSIETSKKAEEEKIRTQKSELEREKERLRQEFSRLRVLASTGTLIFIFTHEIQALIEDMKLLMHRLTEIINKAPPQEQQKYSKDLKTFNDRIQMIQDFQRFLGLSIGKESQSEMRKWIIKPIVDDIESPFKMQIEKRGISFNNAIPETIRTPLMYRSEFIAIIHNLMSNAIKAVTGQQDRRIEIQGFEKNDILYLRCLDSGKGLDKELWETVFKPFNSYGEPDLTYGAGTGLGLKIVRDIVEAYEGEVNFIPPPSGWNTCIQIKIPLVKNGP
ncbi:MAG: ATP-binding protein [Methanoregula sp.]|nr:ATP-binding protein [Methanoregula sp.]